MTTSRHNPPWDSTSIEEQESKIEAAQSESGALPVSGLLENLMGRNFVEIELSPCLDARSSISLSLCSRFFYQKNQSYAFWKDKLFELGCPANVLQTLISNKLITHYRKLYEVIFMLPPASRAILQPWSLCCLSGERAAIDWALAEGGMSEATRNNSDNNPLHYLALSGSLTAFDYGINLFPALMNKTDNAGLALIHYVVLSRSPRLLDHCVNDLEMSIALETNAGTDIALMGAMSGSQDMLEHILTHYSFELANCVDMNNQNLLHYAALSGSVRTMKYCVDVLKISPDSSSTAGLNALLFAASKGNVAAVTYCIEDLKLPITHVDKSGAGILHYAAFSGSIALMRHLMRTDPLDINLSDNNGMKPLHYAAMTGSIETMQYCAKYSASPRLTDNIGANALHYAVMSGHVKAIQYCIEQLHIPIESRTTQGMNCLQMAAKSGASDVIRLIRSLGLNPNEVDSDGHDAFWYADKSVNPAAVLDALNSPLVEINNTIELSDTVLRI